MRKAQMEMFGLVIVVLLIMMGFLIWLRLDGMKPNSERFMGTEWERRQMATNFLDAMLQATTECGNQDLATLLATCQVPGITGLTCTSGRNPCNESHHIIDITLSETLDYMGYEYRLNFSVVDEPAKWSKASDNFGCKNNRVDPGIFIYNSPITGSQLQLWLDICG